MLAREREKEKEKTKGRDLLLGSVKDKKINPKIKKVFFLSFYLFLHFAERGKTNTSPEESGGGGHCGAKQRRRNVSFHLKPLPLPLAASAAASSTSSSATTNSLPIASSNRLA